jgi:hypothetical protein
MGKGNARAEEVRRETCHAFWGKRGMLKDLSLIGLAPTGR